MIEAAKKQNIIFQYLVWHFFDMPREILAAWKNFLFFNLSHFSIPLLIKTLFSPWRKYRWSYGRGFDPARYLEVFFSNLISRFLGLAVRIILILFALILEVFIFMAGLIVFFAWLFLPAFLIAGLFFGFKIIF